jgi:hypothetical protein
VLPVTTLAHEFVISVALTKTPMTQPGEHWLPFWKSLGWQFSMLDLYADIQDGEVTLEGRLSKSLRETAAVNAGRRKGRKRKAARDFRAGAIC